MRTRSPTLIALAVGAVLPAGCSEAGVQRRDARTVGFFDRQTG
jgi:hypothetical protein